jgi:hypothetical protein
MAPKDRWLAREAGHNVQEAKEYRRNGIHRSQFGQEITPAFLVDDRVSRGIYTKDEAEQIKAVIVKMQEQAEAEWEARTESLNR